MTTDTKAKIFIGLIIVAFIGSAIAIRLAWAKWVYHDSRCAFAECRINVNPK